MVHRRDAHDDGWADLGFARVDVDRAHRTGDAEVVYAAGKTPQQTVELLRTLREHHPDHPALATRVPPETMAEVQAAFADGSCGPLLMDEVARAVVLGALPPPRGLVGVVAAGTSDAPVAAEAALTARVFGAGVDRIDDVGVAGVHRTLAVADRFEECDCLIVVAGMEGALPSVVGGLSGTPLVAVPTSVGYGMSLGGVAALLGMLNSCAPGVVVVNVDNGFGAGVHAARVARGSARAAATDPTAAAADARTAAAASRVAADARAVAADPRTAADASSAAEDADR